MAARKKAASESAKETKEIYLDNSATTRCLDEVAQLMATIYTRDYGNPSSAHHFGVVAEKHLREAKEKIAKILRVGGIVFYFRRYGE